MGVSEVTSQQLVTMVSNTVNAIIPTLVTQIAQTLAPTLTETQKSVENMRELMHDQATIYDQERNEIKSLIGFHDANTKRIVNTIKEKLSDKFNINVYASNPIFQRVKREVFKEFKVVKWEDVSVQDYSKVFSFVDTYIGEMKDRVNVI